MKGATKTLLIKFNEIVQIFLRRESAVNSVIQLNFCLISSSNVKNLTEYNYNEVSCRSKSCN